FAQENRRKASLGATGRDRLEPRLFSLWLRRSRVRYPSPTPTWLLVPGCWLLVAGCWLLVIGTAIKNPGPGILSVSRDRRMDRPARQVDPAPDWRDCPDAYLPHRPAPVRRASFRERSHGTDTAPIIQPSAQWR